WAPSRSTSPFTETPSGPSAPSRAVAPARPGQATRRALRRTSTGARRPRVTRRTASGGRPDLGRTLVYARALAAGGSDVPARPTRSVPAAAPLVAAALLLALPLAAPAEDAASDAIRAAVDSPQRSAENRARDPHRRPVETLRFLGLRPDMHVLEPWPGRGRYAGILRPVLRERGHLTVTNADPDGPQDQYAHRIAREFASWLEAERERLGDVTVIVVDPPEKLNLGPDASQDMVLTFRNNHTWINGGYEDAVYAEIYRVLKPGGVLGVVQHRAAEGADPKVSAKSGYVPEAAVIEAAERAGFELAARSEINANPKDTRDYEAGVWTLPPTYRLGDRDRAKYEAIGESDRMTLRFVKPATATAAAE